MDFNNPADLEKNSFTGFKTIDQLNFDSSVIPKKRGVYLVLHPDPEKISFVYPGTGGFFKQKDPNLEISELVSKWVRNSIVVYIGKAGSLTGAATLNSRLRQYLRFGQGKAVGHYGGRLIWQIKNSQDLIICWKTLNGEEPRSIESMIIADFVRQFGKLPFANMVK